MSASTAGAGTVPIEMWSAIYGLVRRWAIAEFRIDGEPVAWQRAGRNVEQGVTYTPKRTREGKEAVAAAFRAARPDWVPTGDLAIGLLLTLRAARLTRADGDNMLKLVMDALNQVAYADDWQVADFLVRLDRGVDDPHTSVIVYPAAANVHRKPRTRRPRQTIPITPMIQRRVFNVITGLLAAGRRPALGDIAAAAGLSTASQARDVVAALEESGFLTYDRRQFTIHKPYEGRSTA